MSMLIDLKIYVLSHFYLLLDVLIFVWWLQKMRGLHRERYDGGGRLRRGGGVTTEARDHRVHGPGSEGHGDEPRELGELRHQRQEHMGPAVPTAELIDRS